MLEARERVELGRDGVGEERERIALRGAIYLGRYQFCWGKGWRRRAYGEVGGAEKGGEALARRGALESQALLPSELIKA